MKILVIGGHLTPALAVIEKFSKEDEILYVGRKHAIEGDSGLSLEYKTITEIGIKFTEIKTGRLQRGFTKHTIPSLLKIPSGFFSSIKIMKNFKPDVVVGFGGYVSFPLVISAFFLKVPIVLHEQTLGIGLANKYLARFADKICISFPSTSGKLPKEKVVLTGNPIRESVIKPKNKLNFNIKKPLIFVTGGNQGSHFINNLIYESLTELLTKFSIIHQTGDSHEYRDFDKLEILKQGLNLDKKDKYVVSKFFSPNEISGIINESDIVISRAGINTISELIFLKKPAILIPLPNSQKNEQLSNAKFFEELGLGKTFEQSYFKSNNLENVISDMFKNIKNYKINKSESYFSSDAADRIIKVIYATAKNNN